jgi:hypothetical protein
MRDVVAGVEYWVDSRRWEVFVEAPVIRVVSWSSART